MLCIDDNMDALTWRLQLIASAQEEIDISTFDFMADESGMDIMSALVTAADRGVNVRVIVDGLTGLVHLKGKTAFEAMNCHPNITVKFYNPVNIITPWKLNARLHDKYFIVDNQNYLLGGRNLYNLFLGEYPGGRNADRDLLIYTPKEHRSDSSVAALHQYFEEMWALKDNTTQKNKKQKNTENELDILKSKYIQLTERLQHDYNVTLGNVDYEQATYAVNRLALLTNPTHTGNKQPIIWEALCAYMKQGKDVVIQTPYIICSDNMYEDLKDVVENGISVNILTNAVESGANPWGCVDYMNQKKKILKTGVSVCEVLGQHSLHKKTVLIDDNISIVGSFNMDMRSAYLDTEMMLVVDSPALNEQLRKQAEQDIRQSRQVTSDGAVIYGEDYAARELPTKKKIAYAMMRVLLVPFRYLL